MITGSSQNKSALTAGSWKLTGPGGHGTRPRLHSHVLMVPAVSSGSVAAHGVFFAHKAHRQQRRGQPWITFSRERATLPAIPSSEIEPVDSEARLPGVP